MLAQSSSDPTAWGNFLMGLELDQKANERERSPKDPQTNSPGADVVFFLNVQIDLMSPMTWSDEPQVLFFFKLKDSFYSSLQFSLETFL